MGYPDALLALELDRPVTVLEPVLIVAAGTPRAGLVEVLRVAVVNAAHLLDLQQSGPQAIVLSNWLKLWDFTLCWLFLRHCYPVGSCRTVRRPFLPDMPTQVYMLIKGVLEAGLNDFWFDELLKNLVIDVFNRLHLLSQLLDLGQRLLLQLNFVLSVIKGAALAHLPLVLWRYHEFHPAVVD